MALSVRLIQETISQCLLNEVVIFSVSGSEITFLILHQKERILNQAIQLGASCHEIHSFTRYVKIPLVSNLYKIHVKH